MIAHCYLIHGGEPLQTEEIISEIYHQAIKGGYNKKVVFDINTLFNWDELLNKCLNLDLFADRTVVELRLHSDTVNKQGTKILEQILHQQDPNNCFIIRAPKLKAPTLNSNWVKHIQQHGKIHVAKPITVNLMPALVTKRLQDVGFKPTAETVNLIVKCYAGNLLAVAQFIQKISVVLPTGILEAKQITPFIDDNSQYSTFELSNVVMQGNTQNAVQILKRLQAENADPILVLWTISRDIRNLLTIKHAIQNGMSFEASAQKVGIWRDHFTFVKKAVDRLSIDTLTNLLYLAKTVDLVCKGMQPGNAWELLLSMCLSLTGSQIFNMEELHL